jgi:hypothetical protein
MGEQMRLAALIALMLSGLAFGAVEVTIVSSRGALTNQVAFATNTFLSAEDSEFYKQTIYVTPFDVMAAVKAGTNDLDAVDFSCVTSEGKQATLVAPNIAVGCEHYHHGVGDDMIFGAYTAKVIRVELEPIYYPDGTPYIYEGEQQYYDYCFMELDRNIPVQPAILAPANWIDFFELNGFSILGYDVPIVVVNQSGSVRVGIIYRVGTIKQSIGMFVGDSGSPSFFIMNGRPVLIGVMTSVKNYQIVAKDLMPVERGWGL